MPTRPAPWLWRTLQRAASTLVSTPGALALLACLFPGSGAAQTPWSFNYPSATLRIEELHKDAFLLRNVGPLLVAAYRLGCVAFEEGTPVVIVRHDIRSADIAVSDAELTMATGPLLEKGECLALRSMLSVVWTRTVDGVEWSAGEPMCQLWLGRIDKRWGTVPPLDARPSDDAVLQGIGCLLRSRGNRQPARFSGATRSGVSQLLPEAKAEIAALYYISFLLTGNWQHGDGVALWDESGRINPPGSLDTAYSSYAAWFQRVRDVGLPAARSQNLDPLAGTGLRWYGK